MGCLAKLRLQQFALIILRDCNSNDDFETLLEVHAQAPLLFRFHGTKRLDLSSLHLKHLHAVYLCDTAKHLTMCVQVIQKLPLLFGSSLLFWVAWWFGAARRCPGDVDIWSLLHAESGQVLDWSCHLAGLLAICG